jgi:hypothetical protein
MSPIAATELVTTQLDLVDFGAEAEIAGGG